MKRRKSVPARHPVPVFRVTNLFNTDYAMFGLLGEADEVLGDEFDDARFLSPGAPRAAWVGIEVSFLESDRPPIPESMVSSV